MTAKFIIFRDKAKKIRFRLKAPNNEIIAVGEAYESKESCLKGILSVQKNAPIAEVEDLTLGRARHAAEVDEAAPRTSAPQKMAAGIAGAGVDFRADVVAAGFMRCNCVSCSSRIKP
jgi:uncharacterized protein YegP (UPF0339 family)